jgi:uncharacterized membrane protein YphA (DoxX/SURF4 family)
MSSSTRLNLGLLLARIPLGGLFLMGGLMKIAGKDGVSGFVSSAMSNVPAFLPPALGKGYLYALPFVELITGAMVLLGIFTRINALVQALILISIIIAMGIQGPMISNVVLLGIALQFALVGGGDISVERVIGGKKKSASA